MNRILLFLFIAILLPTQPEAASKSFSSYKWELAVATIFRDEARFLREWIEYHKLVGVEHFYLYNNLSQDEYLEVLWPYLESGEVELTEWPLESDEEHPWIPIQCSAYQDALSRAKGQVKWLAIIDSDEFLVPVKDNGLQPLLSRFENDRAIGGICAIWLCFGTSVVQKVPENRLMIEVLLLHGQNYNFADFWYQGAFKSIVRPERVLSLNSPHYAQYKEGFQHRALPYEEIQINHYWARDEEFLKNVKLPRKVKRGWSPERIMKAGQKGMNRGSCQNDPILKFVPSLRKEMGFDGQLEETNARDEYP